MDIGVKKGKKYEFIVWSLQYFLYSLFSSDAGFAHRLILKDGAVPAIKDPGHDSELLMISETASNVFVLLVIGAQVLVTL